MKYTDYQLPKTRAWLDAKIDVVMNRTGCDKAKAIAALEAEEWDISDAIVDILAETRKPSAQTLMAAAQAMGKLQIVHIG